MDEAGARYTGRLAIAVGAVAVGSAACIATYFAAGGPFGTINDVGNAATGVLSGCLALRLRRQIPGRSGDVAAGAAVIGAAITVVGSGLVISGTTGFFLAGLVSSVGFAGIGTWLLALNRRGGRSAAPPRLGALGLAAGALMLLGLVGAPGIVLGLDDVATAPAWTWIASLGWIGTYVLYPAWAIRLGVLERRAAGPARPSYEVTASQPTIEVR
jgi:hypothetical protein